MSSEMDVRRDGNSAHSDDSARCRQPGNALIFPVLVWLSVCAARGAGLDVSHWLTAGACKLPSMSRWYVFALFGSQSRDMCPMPANTSFLMKVHHYVVTLACLLSLLAPKGFGLFIAGTFILDCKGIACLLPITGAGVNVLQPESAVSRRPPEFVKGACLW
eukprot:s7113_g1.t1